MERVYDTCNQSVVLAAAVVCVTAVVSLAQTDDNSTQTKNFEVLAVDGNVLDRQAAGRHEGADGSR